MLNAAHLVMLNAVKHLVIQRLGFFAPLRMTRERRRRTSLLSCWSSAKHLVF